MKKLSFFLIFLFLVASVTAYGKSGGRGSAMTGGGHGAQHQINDTGMMGQGNKMMEHHQGEMGQMHMMREQEMHQNMSTSMEKMRNMTEHMNRMMNTEMNSENAGQMADTMKNMSKHMMDMSVMMKKKQCTATEMEKLNKEVSDTEQQFKELENF